MIIARYLALLTSLLIVLPAYSQPIKNPDTIIFATTSDADSFDPAWSYDAESLGIIQNVYEHLLAYKGSTTTAQDLVPLIATHVPTISNGLISKNGLIYRFPIRSGVKFHDGSELTVADVQYSLLRFMLLDRDGGPSSLLLEPILGITSTRQNGKPIADLYERANRAITIDDGAIVIKLTKPFSPLPTILASMGAIVNRRWCIGHGQWDGKGSTWQKYNNPRSDQVLPKELVNGTGPYKLSRYDRLTKQIVLERHEGYWRKPAAIKTVIIKIVEEFATRKLMLLAGDVDVIYAPQMYFPQLKGLSGVTLIDGLQSLEVPAFLTFNFRIDTTGNNYVGSAKLDGHGISSDFFSDPDMRKAFAYTIDYTRFIRDIYHGKAHQPTGIIPAGLLGHKTNSPSYFFDLDIAAGHFKKAWGGKVWQNGFKVSLPLAGSSPPALVLSQMIKKNVESLNPKFQIDIRSVQWSTYLEQKSRGKIPFELAAWQADYPDPHALICPILRTGSYFSVNQHFSVPRIDLLIDEAARSLDSEKRSLLYKKIQDLSDEHALIIPIASSPRYRAQRSWIKGFIFRPMFAGMPYNSYYYDLSKGE